MRRTFLFLLLLLIGVTTSVISSSFIRSSGEISSFMKKKKKKKAKKKKKKAPKSNCDASKLMRSSSDSIILNKYIALYKGLGGVCYIKSLQEMGDLEKTGEGLYTVYLGKSKTPDDRMAWTTFMYCPIGKPDGFVALVQPSGDTVQYCTYKNERKEGKMVWLKPRYGVIANFEFVNDEKPAEAVQDYDPNAGAGEDSTRPEEERRRTDE